MAFVAFMAIRPDVISQTAFQYKEIYMQADDGMLPRNIVLNDLNRDWGLWGHNLHKAIGSQLPQSAFALVDNRRNEEQFCFSSEVVYNRIVDFINDSYGPDGNVRFSIMPYDNSLSCTCNRCKALGNTVHDSEPAVTALIRKLCRRFPNHTFFTSCYLSTSHIPQKTLPKNAGVILSAINWPLRWGTSGKENDFRQLTNDWKKITNNIYVWDYISNFDDYFTPFPVLAIMQQRLQLYKSLGIKGVFLNGSGDDYSSFADVKYYVLANLLNNPELKWQDLVKRFFKNNYPESGDVLAGYIIGLENKCVERSKSLNFYSGTSEAIKSYLDVEDFVRFYDRISALNTNINGSEHTRLDKLICALSLTRLELCRITSDYSSSSRIMTQLSRVVEKYGMIGYNESGWKIRDYISDFKVISEGEQHLKNILRGVRFKALTPLDEDYSDTRVLTDGADGIASNYHGGWMISTQGEELDLYAEFPIQNCEKNKLQISFLCNKKLRISLPRKIEVWSSGKLLATSSPIYMESSVPRREVVSVSLNMKKTDNLTIKCFRDISHGKNIGLSEIRMITNTQ